MEHGLTPGPLYVPPAWALGAVNKRRLAALPFRYYETLGGLYDARDQRFQPMPLLGFEADTTLRAWSLNLFNRGNYLAALASGRTLRVSIHPQDLQLRLGAQVLPWVRRLERPLEAYA